MSVGGSSTTVPLMVTFFQRLRSNSMLVEHIWRRVLKADATQVSDSVIWNEFPHLLKCFTMARLMQIQSLKHYLFLIQLYQYPGTIHSTKQRKLHWLQILQCHYKETKKSDKMWVGYITWTSSTQVSIAAVRSADTILPQAPALRLASIWLRHDVTAISRVIPVDVGHVPCSTEKLILFSAQS